MAIKSNKYEFIEKCNIIHNNKYDYHLVEYINNQTKVKIICKKCNNIFEQTPHNHLKGQGCPKCNGRYSKIQTNDEFKKKCEIIHNYKYKYPLNDYKNQKSIINIICPIHGEFTQVAHSHLEGHGCSECNGGIRSNKDEFIKKSNIIHKNKYDYSSVEYINAFKKITINCPIHGDFQQSPNKHLSGRGCPKCYDSKGELKIKEYLDSNNINYETQKKFEGCKYKKNLKFDFYLPKYNICIEYDGEQHNIRYRFEKDDNKLNIRKIRDNIKNNYCTINNIKLFRISHKNNIEEELTKIIN